MNRSQEIYDYAKAHPGQIVTYTELAEALGMSRRTIGTVVSAMRWGEWPGLRHTSVKLQNYNKAIIYASE